jgi:hypothetical protein
VEAGRVGPDYGVPHSERAAESDVASALRALERFAWSPLGTVIVVALVVALLWSVATKKRPAR